jgi:hypothetical protein
MNSRYPVLFLCSRCGILTLNLLPRKIAWPGPGFDVAGALRNVGDALDQREATLVFFFSGHGRCRRRRNMLATVDAEAAELALPTCGVTRVDVAAFDRGSQIGDVRVNPNDKQ